MWKSIANGKCIGVSARMRVQIVESMPKHISDKLKQVKLQSDWMLWAARVNMRKVLRVKNLLAFGNHGRLPSNAWHCSDNSSPKLSLAVLVAQELLSIRLSNYKCTKYPQQSPNK